LISSAKSRYLEWATASHMSFINTLIIIIIEFLFICVQNYQPKVSYKVRTNKGEETKDNTLTTSIYKNKTIDTVIITEPG
jgi:capsule polysaccharide export protein KpsE/RkpR